MIVLVRIPLFGTDIEEAEVANWLKKENQHINEGEDLVELETTKAVFVVPSNATGKILKILCAEGEIVSTHVPLAVIGTEETDSFEESVLIEKGRSDEWHRLTHYGQEKLKHTIIESEASIQKSVRLTPRAKKVLKSKTSFSAQWAASHFCEGTVHERDIEDLLSRTPVACVGAGPGITRAFEILRRQQKYKVVEILDDNREFWGKEVLGIPVKRGVEELPDLQKELNVDTVCMSVFSEARIDLFKKLKEIAPDITLLPLIDSRANIGTGVTIEEGVLIEAGATIGTNAHIGRGSRVNIGTVIAHDCYLEPFVHVAPGAMIGGKVYIGTNTLIGIGATLNANIIVGKNCIISNSSALLSDLDDNLLVAGNPASVISKSKRKYRDD